MAKAERKSTVHRRVPLDLVVVPVPGRQGQDRRHRRPCRPVDQRGAARSAGGGAGPAPPARSSSTSDFGFDPKGHSGKALRHAVASLPRDLLLTIDHESLRQLVMMAMSLADRPRPALLQVRSILKGQLFSFVWLPREELTTARRHGDRRAARSGGRPRGDQLVGRARRRRPRAHPLHPIYRRGGARSPMPRRSIPRSSKWSAAGARRSRAS